MNSHLEFVAILALAAFCVFALVRGNHSSQSEIPERNVENAGDAKEV
jgi:hypothetical protein